jgi:DAACS family dicarboxylate/amino acid:cation (Na+ or H+) symporter
MLLGVAIGASAGVAAFVLAGDSPLLVGFIRYVTEPAGKIFLRLLFMLVMPLIFSALALGVAGLGDLKRLGWIGLKTLAYTVVVSAIAVMLGVFLVNLLRPGEGLSAETRARLTDGAAGRASAFSGGKAPATGLGL